MIFLLLTGKPQLPEKIFTSFGTMNLCALPPGFSQLAEHNQTLRGSLQ
jgi:hypothetical protein